MLILASFPFVLKTAFRHKFQNATACEIEAVLLKGFVFTRYFWLYDWTTHYCVYSLN